MKFGVWMNGDLDDVEASDADEAAENAARAEYNSCGEPPSSHYYDVTVMAPDGTISRHDVLIEWDPTFSSYDHHAEPDEAAVAALRADRAREEGGAT